MKKLSIVLGLILVLLIGYHLFSGRLFPLSPLKFGYQQQQFSKSIFIWPEGLMFPKEIRDLDLIFKEAEEFYQLSFNRKETIIIPMSESRFYGYT